MSLRHAGSLTIEADEELESTPLPELPNMRRGISFSCDDMHKSGRRASPQRPSPQRPSLNRQKSNLSQATLHSRLSSNTGSKTKSSTNRKSPGISLRTPAGEMEFTEQLIQQKGFRSLVKSFIMSQNFEMFAGFVILGNFIAIIIETDARATITEHSRDSGKFNEAHDMLSLCDHINLAFLLFYAAECIIRLFALGKTFFSSKWNIFDMAIVVAGVVGEVLEVAFASLSSSNMEHFQVLRSLRMLRLLRAARVIISFKELYSLVVGMSSCLRTLIWAAGLLFLMLTMWSIIAVEYLHTYVVELARDGFYDDCPQCSESFSNIMYANLTFFQIVSGDSWSQLARPLIMKYPVTAVFFVGVIFTMVFGMLNLVTAVIVDTAAAAREEDVMHMAAQKEYERKSAWKNVANLVTGMDRDRDGNITLAELRRGTEQIPELNAALSAMGVEWADLRMVFDMFDEDETGKIPIGEFVKHLYKMQTHEHKTTHVFVKHYVEDIRKHVIWLRKMSEEWSKHGTQDFGKEPEGEPKNQSPPCFPLAASNQAVILSPLESIVDIAGSDSQGASVEAAENGGLSGLAPKIAPALSLQPAVHSAESAHLGSSDAGQDRESGNKLSPVPSIYLPSITRDISNCSSEGDLEIGQCPRFDDAIEQFQINHKGGFPALSNAPISSLAQLSRSSLPTLLDKQTTAKK